MIFPNKKNGLTRLLSSWDRVDTGVTFPDVLINQLTIPSVNSFSSIIWSPLVSSACMIFSAASSTSQEILPISIFFISSFNSSFDMQLSASRSISSNNLLQNTIKWYILEQLRRTDSLLGIMHANIWGGTWWPNLLIVGESGVPSSLIRFPKATFCRWLTISDMRFLFISRSFLLLSMNGWKT